MRKTVLLLPLMAAFSAAVAQPLYTSKNNFSQHTIDALKRGSSSQNKGTSAMERISATATYSINMSGGMPGLELSDSTKYKYSNARGSNFDPAKLNDMDAEISEFVLFDSSWNYTDNGNGIELNELVAAAFNAGNKRTSLVSYSSKGSAQLSANTDFRYEYNTDGNISIEHKLQWNKGNNSWDSVSRTYYDYNAQKKLSQKRFYNTAKKAWEVRETYRHNASANVDTILVEHYSTTWTPASREIHVLTSGNTLIKSLVQSFENTSWVNQRLDTFGYTTGASFYTFNESRNWDTTAAAWVKSSQRTRTINTQKILTVETIKGWDTAAKKWNTEAELKWVYNANNNPLRLDISTPLMPLPVPITQVHMYYESYFNTSVTHVNANATITMFPNPATDKVTINFDKENSSSVVISMTNMAGQIVLNSQRSTPNGSTEVSLQGLQPGVYNVSVQFANGTVSSQRIIKQ